MKYTLRGEDVAHRQHHRSLVGTNQEADAACKIWKKLDSEISLQRMMIMTSIC